MIFETGSEPRKAAYDRRGGPLPTTLWLLALTFAIVVPLVSAQADLRVDITRGQVEPMPVAISDLYGESDDAAKFGRRISEVVARNLERSGLFRPIDQRAFIQRPEAMLSGPRFADWRQINAQALVTGDSLGQVASQTLENLHTIDSVATMPILRPLVGMHKAEIIKDARAMGSFDTSIEPHDDCCSFLMPPKPATRSTPEQLEAAEKSLDTEKEVLELVEAASVETIRGRLD